MKRIITLLVACIFYAINLSGQDWEQVDIIYPPPFLTANENFGEGVAVNGNFAVVGVPHSDVFGDDTGIAYVFEFNGISWDKVAQLRSSNPKEGDLFGMSVDITADYIAIGAPGYLPPSEVGAVLVFEKPLSGWEDKTEDAILSSGVTGSMEGTALAIQNNLIFSGLPGSNRIVVYKKPVSGWENTGMIRNIFVSTTPLPAGDQFGASLAVNGALLIVGAPGDDESAINAGAAYVFEEPTVGWGAPDDGQPIGYTYATAKLTAFDAGNNHNFGEAVGAYGDFVAIGASGRGTAGQAYLFEKPLAGWADGTENMIVTSSDGQAGDGFGSNLMLQTDNLFVTAPTQSTGNVDGGAVYVFSKTQPDWTSPVEAAKLTASDNATGDKFGYSIGLSGSRLISGAPFVDDPKGVDAGKAYVFEMPVGGWVNGTENSSIVAEPGDASGGEFGTAVDMDGYYAIIGSFVNNKLGTNTGIAHVYKFSNAQWNLVAELTPSDPADNDRFAETVAISGGTIVIGNGRGITYLYEKPVGEWADAAETARLTVSTIKVQSLAIEGDVVVAGYAGAVGVFVFEKPVGGWADMTQTAFLQSVETSTPAEVDISGTVIIYGSLDLGVFVFEKPGANWTNMASETAKLTVNSPETAAWVGYSVAIDGNVIVAGAPLWNDDLWLDPSPLDQGRIFLFERPVGGWANMTETAILSEINGENGDKLGRRVAIRGDVVMGGKLEIALPFAQNRGRVLIYNKPTGGWSGNIVADQQVTLLLAGLADNDVFGSDMAISGSRTLFGTPGQDARGTQAGLAAYFSSSANPTVVNVPSIAFDEDTQSTSVIDLYNIFEDVETLDVNLVYDASFNSNMIDKVEISGQFMTIYYLPDVYGNTSVGVTATDEDGKSVTASIQITINPVADSPVVPAMAGTYGVLQLNQFIEKSAVDGNGLQYFKFTEITNLNLETATGQAIAEGSFIEVGNGLSELGIRYTPFSVPVASFKIQASLTNDDSGLGGSVALVQITVSKKTLSVSAQWYDKIYGEINPELGIFYYGFVLGEDTGVLDVLPATTTPAIQFSDVGIYEVIPDGGVDDHYNFNYVNGQITINQALLQVLPDGVSKEYGDPNPVLTITYMGFKGTDTESVLDEIPVISTTTVPFSPPGNYPISFTGGFDNNYQLNFGATNLSVMQAPLTATADDITTVFGDPVPELSITYSGFKGSDNIGDIDQLPVLFVSAVQGSNAGIYFIIFNNTGSDDNYSLVYQEGTLTIEKANQTITFEPLNPVTFGFPTFELVASASSAFGVGFSSSDPQVASVTGVLVTITGAGEALITASQQGDMNYNAAPDVQQTLIVNKADQTITFNPIPDKNAGDASFLLDASATTGFTISYTSSDVTVATVSGFTVTIVGAGTTTITASQAGNSNFNPAPDVSQQLTVSESNSPPVIPDQSFAIDENSSFGTSVGMVQASDPDNDPLQFSITSGNTGTAFNVNAPTGELTVNNSAQLDFEASPSFTLTIQVEDGNGGSATATVVIQLNDLDESGNNPPVMADQVFNLDENSPDGSFVGDVQATDPENDPLNFTIVSGNDGEPFSLASSTGALNVNNSVLLDFETTPVFSLTVLVEDGRGGSNSALITVNLNDISEGTNSPPVVSDQTLSVDENSPNGTLIATIQANDPDNDPLTFTILQGNTNGVFTLNQTSGDLTVNDNSNLDFESTPVFNLVVEVSDGVNNPVTASITINLNDVEEILTSIESEELLSNITIYPNPAEAYFNLEVRNLTSADLVIRLMDVAGSQVTILFSGVVSGAYQTRVLTEKLNPGMYVLHVKAGDTIIQRKLIIR